LVISWTKITQGRTKFELSTRRIRIHNRNNPELLKETNMVCGGMDDSGWSHTSLKLGRMKKIGG